MSAEEKQAKSLTKLLSPLVPVLVAALTGSAGGYGASSVNQDQRFHAIEARVEQVQRDISEQMAGYKIMNASVTAMNNNLREENRELRTEIRQDLDRITSRLDRLIERGTR